MSQDERAGSEVSGAKIDDMERLRPGRGRYVVNAKGEVTSAGSLSLPGSAAAALPSPEGVVSASAQPMGPTRLGEWLMVDVRTAQAIPPDSRLFAVCRGLVERGHCGIVESTLVIDLLEARTDDRHYLLDMTNWPVPAAT